MAVFISCLDCQRSFEDYRVERAGGQCPDCNKPDKLVEVDDMIAHTIIKLNNKGYWTQFCCSGHVSDVDYDPFARTYIMFDDSVFRHIDSKQFFRDLPVTMYVQDPWVHPIHGADPRPIIRPKQYICRNVEDKIAHVARINIDLHRWAKNLPTLELTQEQKQDITDHRNSGKDYRSLLRLTDG